MDNHKNNIDMDNHKNNIDLDMTAFQFTDFARKSVLITNMSLAEAMEEGIFSTDEDMSDMAWTNLMEQIEEWVRCEREEIDLES
jgi:hypothetical protein